MDGEIYVRGIERSLSAWIGRGDIFTATSVFVVGIDGRTF
jgi:hypothetical protein